VTIGGVVATVVEETWVAEDVPLVEGDNVLATRCRRRWRSPSRPGALVAVATDTLAQSASTDPVVVTPSGVAVPRE